MTCSKRKKRNQTRFSRIDLIFKPKHREKTIPKQKPQRESRPSIIPKEIQKKKKPEPLIIEQKPAKEK